MFGEGPADRRERLRHILALIGADAIRKERIEAIAEKKKRDEVYHKIPNYSGGAQWPGG